MNLTKEQLLAGAESLAAEVMLKDPYNDGGQVELLRVTPPDQLGGWRAQAGNWRLTLNEMEVVMRATVLSIVDPVDDVKPMETRTYELEE